MSFGTVFTNFLFKDQELYYLRLGEFEAPKGDNWNYGIGLACKTSAKVTLNLALGFTIWNSEKVNRAPYPSARAEYSAYAYSLSIGANIDL